MTTQTQTQTQYGSVASVANGHLSAAEEAELLACINAVRAGTREFHVLLTNRKQTRSKKRLPGEHYDPHPALAPHAHKGWLVAAPTNKQGGIYFHIYDEARAKKQGERFGHTRVTLAGLLSFEVLDERPGPLGEAPTVAPVAPHAMVQAMYLQAQALMLMAQATMLMGQPPQNNL